MLPWVRIELFAGNVVTGLQMVACPIGVGVALGVGVGRCGVRVGLGGAVDDRVARHAR